MGRINPFTLRTSGFSRGTNQFPHTQGVRFLHPEAHILLHYVSVTQSKNTGTHTHFSCVFHRGTNQSPHTQGLRFLHPEAHILLHYVSVTQSKNMGTHTSHVCVLQCQTRAFTPTRSLHPRLRRGIRTVFANSRNAHSQPYPIPPTMFKMHTAVFYFSPSEEQSIWNLAR